MGGFLWGWAGARLVLAVRRACYPGCEAASRLGGGGGCGRWEREGGQLLALLCLRALGSAGLSPACLSVQGWTEPGGAWRGRGENRLSVLLPSPSPDESPYLYLPGVFSPGLILLRAQLLFTLGISVGRL